MTLFFMLDTKSLWLTDKSIGAKHYGFGYLYPKKY